MVDIVLLQVKKKKKNENLTFLDTEDKKLEFQNFIEFSYLVHFHAILKKSLKVGRFVLRKKSNGNQYLWSCNQKCGPKASKSMEPYKILKF